jgi:hypothetical protein
VTFFKNRVVFRAIGIFWSMVFMGASVQAADLTLVSGLFQRTSPKIEGKNTGSKTVFGLGGRYSDELSTDMAWLVATDVSLRSYSSGNGLPTPDNSVSLALQGGVRYYFKPFAEAIVPYVTGTASVASTKTADWEKNGYTQVTASGLYYGANAGIRAGLGDALFVELELPFFESPLFSVSETETVTKEADGTKSKKEETTSTALYAQSSAPITSIRLGIGLKL